MAARSSSASAVVVVATADLTCPDGRRREFLAPAVGIADCA
ncbi:hypothetical protein [uncultured Jatrophihabitans sp.]